MCGRLMRQVTSSQILNAKLWEDEEKFGVDLNGDGDTGLVTVEDNRECASKTWRQHIQWRPSILHR